MNINIISYNHQTASSPPPPPPPQLCLSLIRDWQTIEVLRSEVADDISQNWCKENAPVLLVGAPRPPCRPPPPRRRRLHRLRLHSRRYRRRRRRRRRREASAASITKSACLLASLL
jgi:hypothetical protein